MAEIKILKELFEEVKNEQTDALKEIEDLMDEQKNILSMLSVNWKGESAQSFNNGKNSLLGQSIMAKMTLEQLKLKSKFAKENFENKDDETKKIFQ